MLEWLIPVIAYQGVTILSTVPNLLIQAGKFFAAFETALIEAAGIRVSDSHYAPSRRALVWGTILLNHKHSRVIRATTIIVPVLLCVTGELFWNEVFIPPGVSHSLFSYLPILVGHVLVTVIGYYGIRNGKTRLRSEQDPVEVVMEIIRKCEQPPVKASYLAQKQALLARTDAVAEVFRAAYKRFEEDSAAK